MMGIIFNTLKGSVLLWIALSLVALTADSKEFYHAYIYATIILIALGILAVYKATSLLIKVKGRNRYTLLDQNEYRDLSRLMYGEDFDISNIYKLFLIVGTVVLSIASLKNGTALELLTIHSLVLATLAALNQLLKFTLTQSLKLGY